MGTKVAGVPTFCVQHGWHCPTDGDGFCTECGNDAQGEAATDTAARIAELESSMRSLTEERDAEIKRARTAEAALATARRESAEWKAKFTTCVAQLELWKKAPCCLCGYNGPGYYDSRIHSCAALRGVEEG